MCYIIFKFYILKPFKWKFCFFLRYGNKDRIYPRPEISKKKKKERKKEIILEILNLRQWWIGTHEKCKRIPGTLWLSQPTALREFLGCNIGRRNPNVTWWILWDEERKKSSRENKMVRVHRQMAEEERGEQKENSGDTHNVFQSQMRIVKVFSFHGQLCHFCISILLCYA